MWVGTGETPDYLCLRGTPSTRTTGIGILASSTSVTHSENRDEQLAAALAESTRFAALEHLAACDSTQDVAARAEGTRLVWSDHQRLGRGRQQRSWVDEPDLDLALSFRVEGFSAPSPQRLAAAAPVAIARAVEPYLGAPATIKWPNDLLVQGRKLSGLLIDASASTFVLGIGINVNRTRFPAELSESATSLALATGRTTDRHDLVLRLAVELDAALTTLEQAESGCVDALAQEFARRCAQLRRRVVLEGPTGSPEGVLTALDLDRAQLDGTREYALGQIRHLVPK